MIKILVSSVLQASADDAWAAIRDFGGIADWHPGLASSAIEGGHAADAVGCVRLLTLPDGGQIRERLLTLSDIERTCTYSILESPMGVDNYVATLRLLPVTDGGRSYVEWTVEFDCAGDREDELRALIGQGVFQGGLDALKQRFGG